MYGSLAPRLALVPKVLARNALRKGGHGPDVAYTGHNLPFDIVNGNGRLFIVKFTIFCAIPFWLPWINARFQINKQ